MSTATTNTAATTALATAPGTAAPPWARGDARRPDPTPRAADAAAPVAGRAKPVVLVVDDEKDILDLVVYHLQRNGYDVLTADTGDAALDVAVRERPSLILLDLMLPGLSGTEVTRRLKADARAAAIPIIMLTAKSEETDVVVGLTLGADDYVTKPFKIKILLARVASLLRRAEAAAAAPDGAGAAVLRAGPLTIDPDKHGVTVDGEAVKLTLTEFKLLRALVAARGRVLTRDQLMDKAMGVDVAVTDRAIDVHVTAIRKKLGDASWLVRTVRGVGYSLQETAEEE